ncbi:hypothetical protein OsI_36408 [Oryza sativa Indica Group]|uniref:Uncharacterized protein n=1 Tax=Oryza sativa subsp. indica TaxID=39946 RepID=B8BKY1_ORYSI|nr:hypothetical protein OsI_36408 [Oryza sativa Indica Group]
MVMECALEAGAEPCRLLRTRRAGGRGTRLRCAVAAVRGGRAPGLLAPAAAAEREDEEARGGGDETQAERRPSGRGGAPLLCRPNPSACGGLFFLFGPGQNPGGPRTPRPCDGPMDVHRGYSIHAGFLEAVDCLGQLLAEAAFEKSCSWDKLPQTGPKLVDGDFGGDDAVRTSAASDFAEDNMEGEACGHRQEPIHPGGGNFSARRGKGRG